ncbi:hypothetical protein H6788_01530 [Candidatus Nomurabacteria bacterium]|nr:hypothetical protein [Candidatus Nomurabacteria bacterium]MCB9819621.1 hypothetical protein [Candidatus Nomurabacteria bacterium]
MYDTSQQPEMMRERYSELPNEVRELFDYGTVEQTLQKISNEFGLRQEDIPLIQMEIDLILYGFLTREDLPARLQESLNIEETRANQIAERLEEDLFIIVDRFLTYVEELLADDEGGKQPLTTNQPQSKENSTPTPKVSSTAVEQSEEVGASIKPLRTFAEDVELSRVHGYGTFQSGEVTEDADDTPVHRSNQDDIINK